MSNLEKLESNLYESFNRVKSDVLKLSDRIAKSGEWMTKTKEDQLKIISSIENLSSRLSYIEGAVEQIRNNLDKKSEGKVVVMKAPEKVVKTEIIRVSKHKKNKFIASKTGKKFHLESCILARNIKPKTMKVYKSKDAALNAGYKACYCVLNK